MPDNLIFDVQKEPNRLWVRLGTSMALIDKAAEEVGLMMSDNGLKKHAFGVSVVMREGLTNAVRHGNKNDPDKLVLFTIIIENDILTMTIEDEGDGFDWKKIKEARRPGENVVIPLDHGRGIPIIEEYFDEYEYNEKGNILTIKKDVSP